MQLASIHGGLDEEFLRLSYSRAQLSVLCRESQDHRRGIVAHRSATRLVHDGRRCIGSQQAFPTCCGGPVNAPWQGRLL